VYKHEDETCGSALRKLYSHGSVTSLDVFKKKEWKVLQDMKILDMTSKVEREMKKWDYYWRRKLVDILGITITEVWAPNLIFCWLVYSSN